MRPAPKPDAEFIIARALGFHVMTLSNNLDEKQLGYQTYEVVKEPEWQEIRERLKWLWGEGQEPTGNSGHKVTWISADRSAESRWQPLITEKPGCDEYEVAIDCKGRFASITASGVFCVNDTIGEQGGILYIKKPRQPKGFDMTKCKFGDKLARADGVMVLFGSRNSIDEYSVFSPYCPAATFYDQDGNHVTGDGERALKIVGFWEDRNA